MSKSPALLYRVHGSPEQVVELGEVDVPPVGPDEVQLKVLMAPVNPADLNAIEGTYPLVPVLPAVPGGEGVAVVTEIGRMVEGMSIGDKVLLPHSLGTWREQAVVATDQLIRLPDSLAIEQAAMLRVNPATAFRMLKDFTELKPGDWVIQNAANSGVGRAIIEIARSRNLRTINIVRREELLPELKRLGADVVLVDSEALPGEIAAQTAGQPPRLGLNAVGGESALRIANALAAGGTLVTYGAMGRQPLRIPNGLLIFKDVRFVGFWVSRWYRSALRSAVDEMFDELFPLAAAGAFTVPVDTFFGLHQAKAALARASRGGRSGKVMFKIGT